MLCFRWCFPLKNNRLLWPVRQGNDLFLLLEFIRNVTQVPFTAPSCLSLISVLTVSILFLALTTRRALVR